MRRIKLGQMLVVKLQQPSAEVGTGMLGTGESGELTSQAIAQSVIYYNSPDSLGASTDVVVVILASLTVVWPMLRNSISITILSPERRDAERHLHAAHVELGSLR